VITIEVNGLEDKKKVEGYRSIMKKGTNMRDNGKLICLMDREKSVSIMDLGSLASLITESNMVKASFMIFKTRKRYSKCTKTAI
jgi:hypothetical protein